MLCQLLALSCHNMVEVRVENKDNNLMYQAGIDFLMISHNRPFSENVYVLLYLH